MDGVPEAVGGMSDHVHLLVGLRATHRLADVLRDLKRASSEWVHTTIGLRTFAWQEGYGAFTVSASNRGQVRAYIVRQEEHHRSRTFREEYVEFLQRYDVEFAEKYLRLTQHLRAPCRGAMGAVHGPGDYPRLISINPPGFGRVRCSRGRLSA